MSITENDYQDAKDIIDAVERDKNRFLSMLPVIVHGERLTSAEIEAMRGQVTDALNDVYFRIMEEAKRIRDAYENKEQRAHEHSESTYYGHGIAF